jgi:glycosyltransferase involved in cell wall biosynthesis
MKILHVMPDFPYPPDNGARADIWARLLAMKRLGYTVHAVVMAPKVKPEDRNVAEMRAVVNSLRFVERLPLSKCLASIRPTYISRNSMLSKFPLTDQYDVTLMEAEDTLPICDNPSLNTNLRVLRVHNDEVTYLREFAKAEERFLKRQFIRLEVLRLMLFAASAYRRVDSLWFISETERQRFIDKHPSASAKAVWLPPSIEIGEKSKQARADHKRVLFVGNFYTPLNREGLRWYLSEVHPALQKDPAYEFIVAGSTQGRPDARAFVEEIKNQPRCTVHVDLEDTGPLYSSCILFVNPMRSGAGVKLKTVHAIERFTPVVSTSVGNEGSGFMDNEHLRIANTPAEFTRAITELLSCYDLRGQMAGRAYLHLTRYYNSETNIRRLLEHLVPDSRQPAEQQTIFSS